jgi:chromosome segregation ATPase
VAIEQKVDKLEEALMRLVYIQQKTEMELQSFKNEMKVFKDEMTDFKNEMRVFKDEMKVFKDEMTDFKNEMRVFKDEMLDFKNEMRVFKDEMKVFKDEMTDFKNEMRVFKDEMLDFKEWSKKNIESLNRQWGNLANRMGTLVEDIFFPSMDQTIERYFHIQCDILERNKRIRKDDKSLEIDILVILKKAKQAFIVEVKSNPDRIEYIEGFLEKLDKITQFLPELEEYTRIGIYAGLDMSKETIDLLTKKRIYAMVFKGDFLEIVNYDEFSGVRS